MKVRPIVAVTIVSVCLAVTGCQKNTGSGDASSGGGGGTVGAGSGSTKVPDDARKIAQSTGGRLVHRPLRDGTVYVVDEGANKVVYSGPVRANSNVVVDAKANNVSVNDTEVSVNGKLDPGRKYGLYFVQD